MGYSAKAASIRSSVKNLKEYVENIKGISFGSIWTGDNYNNFDNSLLTASNNISSIADNLENYANGLDKLQQYKNNAERIKELNSQIQSIKNRITKDIGASTISSYNSQIASLNCELAKLIEENTSLKSEIKGAMSAVGGSGSGASLASPSLSTKSTTYVDDMVKKYLSNDLSYLYDLVDKYSSGTLERSSLYNSVDQQYIEDGLEYIQNKYSQRDAAIYSGMFIMSVAANSGVKIPYVMDPKVDNSPYISTKTLVDGADCEVVTDWVVDKGRTDGFTWKAKNNYKNVGEPVLAEENAQNWVSVLPGDLFVNSGHVGVILGNDPVNQTFICNFINFVLAI